MPALSSEQFDAWAKDENLLFSSEDEDIILAQPEALHLILKVIDAPGTLPSKKKVLLAALFVMIYNSLSPKHKDMVVVKTVASALRERRALIAELGTKHVGEYILRRALPAVGDVLPH